MFQARGLEWVAIAFSTEYLDKQPKNLPSPEFFLTQGSNPGLLHCKQILYHLSYRDAPNNTIEQLCCLNEILDLKHLEAGLPALCWLSSGSAPPGSRFEHWQEPPGLELGLQEPQ